ncbi:prenyltransferase [bacterium]|nr:MAG: prenyltransferase [bacterium]
MPKFKTYFLATRPQFLPAVAVPVALGASFSWRFYASFNASLFILSLLAALFYHAGMNVLNDYFDCLNGSDNINKNALTPFTGGSRFIQNGLMTAQETAFLGIILIACGSAIGIYLAYETTWLLLVIGFTGLLSGVFYSAPPVFLVGRGLGELTVGINFGFLTVLGAYAVQTSRIAPEAAVVSLPMSFLIAALLYINEFPDYEADKATSKRTLVVRLGPNRARFYLAVLIAGAYLSIVLGVVFGFLPRLSLIALGSLIFAIPASMGVIKNYKGGKELIPSIKGIIASHLTCGILLTAANLL